MRWKIPLKYTPPTAYEYAVKGLELQCSQGPAGVQMLRKVLTNADFGKSRNMAGVTNPNTNIAFNLPTNRRHGVRENTQSKRKQETITKET